MDYDVVELIFKTPFGVIAAIAGLIVAIVFFSIQLYRFGPAIRSLNKIEVLSQLYHLAETQREMTRAFGEATATTNATRCITEQFRGELESLRDFIIDAQEKMSEYNADTITRVRLEEEEQDKGTGGFFHSFNPIRPKEKSPEELFTGMRREWEKFTEVFKRRLEDANIPPQLNRMGKMTYMLSDKRRRKPLPIETANLITALHSQYRRYIALRAISVPEHDNFIQLVETAIRELAAAPRQGELELPRNGNNDTPSPPVTTH